MNDTILNSRQKKILKLIKDKGALSRLAVADKLGAERPLSKITVIRDLNGLIESGFIKSKGKGRATVYTLTETNPLLFFIDMNDYFSQDLEARGVKRLFNKKIFNKLASLLSRTEASRLEKTAKGLDKRSKSLDPTIFKRELERFVIEFAWKSSQIEGNTYDLLETETLIKQRIEAKGHPKYEAIMILNHKYAFDSIVQKKASFRRLNFSDLVQLHQVLTKNLDISSGIRSQRVGISGTLYEPLAGRSDIKAIIRKLISLINKTAFPPEKALIAACTIAYIQPFADGNKRTARMLANAILLSYDYFPLSYRNVDVDEYKKALILFYEQNSLYHFKRIFLEQFEFAVKNYFRV